MKKIIAFAFVLVISTVATFAGERRIAFERSDAVYVANLDGTADKKLPMEFFLRFRPMGHALPLTPWKRLTRLIRVTSPS